jgi:hypothetical protein
MSDHHHKLGPFFLDGDDEDFELSDLAREEAHGAPFAYASLLASADSHAFASEDEAEADDRQRPRQDNLEDGDDEPSSRVPQWRMAILGLCQVRATTATSNACLIESSSNLTPIHCSILVWFHGVAGVPLRHLAAAPDASHGGQGEQGL